MWTIPSHAQGAADRVPGASLIPLGFLPGLVPTITFATGNPGKLSEARTLLRPLGYEVAQFDAGYPEIQADTLEDVSRYALQLLQGELSAPFMLEDAGLFVDALDGFPGVYSSYVFDTLGNDGILRLLEGVPADERSARFRAVLGYHDGTRPHLFEGVVEGAIATEARGEHGFGFDPIFVPGEGDGRTFGEMVEKEKSELSHRSRALEGLVAYLEG